MKDEIKEILKRLDYLEMKVSDLEYNNLQRGSSNFDEVY